MKTVSIFNHVLGPVMRGPSSSHTAGGFHLGCMARTLLGAVPASAVFGFDPAGSYARTYDVQGADRAFAMGLMAKALTDVSFFTALSDAAASGLDIRFDIRPLDRPDHPNTVEMTLTAPDGLTLQLVARSIGGGEVEITWLEGWPVLFNGTAWELLIETDAADANGAATILDADGRLLGRPSVLRRDGSPRVAVIARRSSPLTSAARAALSGARTPSRVLESAPVYFVQTGQALFSSAAGMVALARERRVSLGRLALEYEATLLGRSQPDVITEMLARYAVMEASTRQGLEPGVGGMQLLSPTAGSIFEAEAAGRVSLGGPHTRAAARAMAVMHVDAAMGVVCAAPTGGSAGTIPGAMVTLAEERRLDREQIALAMLASGAIGVIVAQRATFAAEVAGCQVEIGASGAMAAAAIVDAVGGSAEQACHAAAIGFQNTMGLVCDPVQGMVEIPCHTRNAAAAASAFVIADLVLGGYANPIPLDETIDAVYAVGRAMSTDLLCTAKGGLAVTPSALALGGGCCGKGCVGC
jgi:L-serine dehydratase